MEAYNLYIQLFKIEWVYINLNLKNMVYFV